MWHTDSDGSQHETESLAESCLLITELQDHPDHLQVCFRRSEVRLDPAAELDHTSKKFSCFCGHVDPERPPTENQRTTESFSVDLTDTSGCIKRKQTQVQEVVSLPVCPSVSHLQPVNQHTCDSSSHQPPAGLNPQTSQT